MPRRIADFDQFAVLHHRGLDKPASERTGYTIFGQCDDAAVALVKQIAHMATDPQNEQPFRPVKIVHITIVKSGTAAPVHKPAATTTKKPTAATPKAAPSSNQ